VGSSAASNFADLHPDCSWPELLREELKGQADVRVILRGGLTPIRTIDELLHIEPCDLLILHMGTSIGWPAPIVTWGHKLGIDFHSEHSLHQPAFRSTSRLRRIRGFFKARTRNFVKYLLFFTGMYKPRVNLAELNEQIQTVLDLGYLKAPRIIWIQHRALQHRRIFLERKIYSRFYKRIIEELHLRVGENLVLIREDREFLTPENYLLDYVHLSPQGHRVIFEEVKRFI